MRKKVKIAEIGPYPPPGTGWSVRIKKLKEAFIADGHDCVVLNTGENRKTKNTGCLDVQNAFDYLLKLFMLNLLTLNLSKQMAKCSQTQESLCLSSFQQLLIPPFLSMKRMASEQGVPTSFSQHCLKKSSMFPGEPIIKRKLYRWKISHS